jgi:hypothetical protein
MKPATVAGRLHAEFASGSILDTRSDLWLPRPLEVKGVACDT